MMLRTKWSYSKRNLVSINIRTTKCLQATKETQKCHTQTRWMHWTTMKSRLIMKNKSSSTMFHGIQSAMSLYHQMKARKCLIHIISGKSVLEGSIAVWCMPIKSVTILEETLCRKIGKSITAQETSEKEEMFLVYK